MLALGAVEAKGRAMKTAYLAASVVFFGVAAQASTDDLMKRALYRFYTKANIAETLCHFAGAREIVYREELRNGMTNSEVPQEDRNDIQDQEYAEAFSIGPEEFCGQIVPMLKNMKHNLDVMDAYEAKHPERRR